MSCSPDNTTVGYTYECDDQAGGAESAGIACPVSCTKHCPTPDTAKPCRQATWDSTYCEWNIIRCRDVGGGNCLSGLNTSGEEFNGGDTSDSCSPCNPDQAELDACWNSGGVYDNASCFCGQSPIVIDVLGNGFNLTNYTNGVDFDITGDGNAERIAWTSANSDDSWLALDRNGNGTIDDGKELFGNSTAQPAPPQGEAKNGFLALAEFDKTSNGGNNDGNITQQDTVFQNLRLWEDTNHNGISEANELKTMTQVGLRKIELDYRESRRTDEHGNKFKYRAKVKDAQDAQLGRWAWDVYLAVQP